MKTITLFPAPQTALMLTVLVGALCAGQAAEIARVSSLDLGKVEQGWGNARGDKSVDGNTLSIGGQKFDQGLGTHAESVFRIAIQGRGEQFSAKVGVDDEVGRRGSVVFKVLGDGKELWSSGDMRGGDKAKDCAVVLAGVKELVLKVEDGGDDINFDHADWAMAQISMSEGKPTALSPLGHLPPEPPYVLTPPAPATPRINGAKVFGVRPGAPFLFTVPATGDRPMTFSAKGLPAGLSLDPASGQITGMIQARGTYTATLSAKNARGKTKRDLRIVCGDLIALTPPMGWNSWNCFAGAVSSDKVKAAAEAMVAKGLINHGWSYINIDDCWQAGRDANGKILANEKFPDMKQLTDYIHGLGLKAGTYSSPGPKTCAGFTGSYQHEDLDAARYAEWGFDYLKYDWCSYGEIAPKNPSLAEMKKPYQVMRAALDKVPRDIVYSLCQYGMGKVWEWGGEVGGNCWRTTGDITDTWRSLASIGFSQAGHEKLIGPGHWNDPDMLIVGYVGWSANVRPTRLSPNEQYTHISLWCLLSSPLLIGCDMTRLDDFTLNLLTNDEVLEVNQDPLGRQASRISKQGNLEVWAKDMEDGTKAVGLFNRGDTETMVTAKWADLDLRGKHVVRDLWRQKDLGKYDVEFSTQVPRHGVVLVKINK
jgi:alpha-galactosidase